MEMRCHLHASVIAHLTRHLITLLDHLTTSPLPSHAASTSPNLVSAPSGIMFVTALLVGRGRSRTSNIGDVGQDVITMEDERAW